MRDVKSTTWLNLLCAMLLLEACCNKDLDVAQYHVTIAAEDLSQAACEERIESMNLSGGACNIHDNLMSESAVEYLNYCNAYCTDRNGPEYHTCRGRMTIAETGTPSCRTDEKGDIFELVCGPVVARCVCVEPCMD